METTFVLVLMILTRVYKPLLVSDLGRISVIVPSITGIILESIRVFICLSYSHYESQSESQKVKK